MSRKDSKGLFANVIGQLDHSGDRSGAHRSTSPHLMKVAAGVRQIQERSELADRLLKDGGQIIEIDPENIKESAIPDRFVSAYDEVNLAELISSMREHGQSTPGLVRSVDGSGTVFQIVYGRRRLAAAKLLGIKFKAIVRELSDEDAIVLQGEENSNRDDLSFIERCLFAHAQESAGYGRDLICKSLNTGKSHVSEMIRLANVLPREVVHKIGPAREVGRRRWVDFETRWKGHPSPLSVVREALKSVESKGLTSEGCFVAISEALSTAHILDEVPQDPLKIVSHGLIVGRLSHGKTGSKLAFNRTVPDGFVDYVAAQIENLHDQFIRQKS